MLRLVVVCTLTLAASAFIPPSLTLAQALSTAPRYGEHRLVLRADVFDAATALQAVRIIKVRTTFLDARRGRSREQRA